MQSVVLPSRTVTGIGATVVALSLAACSGPAEGEAASNQGPDRTDDAAAVIASVEATDPELAAELREILEHTQRFRDVEVALAEGYMPDPMDMCVTSAMEGYPAQLGGMGIHYFRPDLLGITEVEPRVAGMGIHEDFREPGVLIYEPQADGSLKLVAVENLIFEAPWRAAGHEGPPAFRGNEYFHLVENPRTEVDEAHGFEPHFELHLWLYRENPAGLFTPFNPGVSCEHHVGSHTAH